MAFQTSYSEQAAVDLADIIRYLNDELCNPQAAKRFYKEASKRLELLCDNPYMYPLHKDGKLYAEGYRFIVIGNYLMFYVINEDSRVVNIVRIVYGGRNLSAIFGE